ncbi:MAG TPA: hypothetical protein VJ731_06870 [Terriglobales bacterium]|nr:hypothetical protein [Terriglobales bacterium]
MRDHDSSLDEIVEALRDNLDSLNKLRLVPHNDVHLLRLKQHLREKIADLEVQGMYVLVA